MDGRREGGMDGWMDRWREGEMGENKKEQILLLSVQ